LTAIDDPRRLRPFWGFLERLVESEFGDLPESSVGETAGLPRASLCAHLLAVAPSIH
jgi:hypothetical protein